MLQGMTPTPQATPEFLVNPITGLPTSYWLSGDPVAGAGWLDGSIDPPGDRRFLLTAGPFNMALGDTQELVCALIAGLGSDRISSVSVMKFYDKTTQAAYNNLFDLPKPPPAPRVTATELNKGVVIEWESDPVGVATTEKSNSKGYVFEGYNVYQLPSASSPLTSGKKIATFDLTTDPSTISQEEFDESSGQVLVKPVQFGKNTGLTRYLYITTDVIKNTPLVNGQHYYFAVTAYNYNKDPKLVTHSFECSPVVMGVTPHSPNPGTVLPYQISDTVGIPVKNVVGSNDAYVNAVVLNPSLQSGQNYDIWYGGLGPLRNATIVRQISGTDYATVTATLDTLTGLTPKVTIPTFGSGTFTINDAKTQISYLITFSGLNGTSGTHKAVIRDTTNRKYLKTLTLVNDTARGVWSKSDATEALADSLIQVFTGGNMYVIAYDSVYTKGVVRGRIANGLVTRFDLPIASPTMQLVRDLGPFEARIPQDGISFYLSQAPLGYKTCLEYSPGSASVVDVVNPGGTYKMIGPASAWAGNRANELPVEIRFTDPATDTSWAVATFPSPNDSPAKAKFVRVPFGTYLNNVRVWPVVFLNNATDTVWSTVGNDLVNGAAVFNKIAINDTTDGTKSISYLSWTTFPPSNSTAKKVPLIQGTSFIAQNIVFVDVKGTGTPPPSGTKIRLTANISVKPGDIKTFTINALQTASFEAAKQSVNGINVFPNPYYGVNSSETSREVRYVTFSHLPRKATIRIFNLAGVLVRTLLKEDDSQFFNWDLNNAHNLPVASGIYLAYIDMGSLGTKTLKLAIIQEQQFLQNY
ncbi:MAG: CHRD domain-containing protein [Ignavibacteriales bacterium]|nr:CHRD domain-containing protein [Ignavibacteriales bacterium]